MPCVENTGQLTMKFTLKHAIAAILLLLSIAAPVAAGPLEDGNAAYKRGDYATAMRSDGTPDAPRVLPCSRPRCGARMIVIEVFARDCQPRWRPTPSTIDTS